MLVLEDNTEPGLELDSVRQWPKRWSPIDLDTIWVLLVKQVALLGMSALVFALAELHNEPG